MSVEVDNILPAGSSLFRGSDDFSATQGDRGWYYMDSKGSQMTYDAEKSRWQGDETYLLLMKGSAHPGINADAVLRWVASSGGEAWVSGIVSDKHAGCGSDGVVARIMRNQELLWEATIPKEDAAGRAFDLRTSVVPNDALDFIVNKGVDTGCDTTELDPTIVFLPAPPPTVSISTPVAGSTVTKTIVVGVDAAGDAGITKVEFYINGALKGTDTTSPYAYSWNTLGVADGTHTLTAKAYDSLLNAAEHSIGVIVLNGRRPHGHHDMADHRMIAGWTCDSDDYSQPLKVHIYDGDPGTSLFLGQVIADVTREEGVGDACGGYRDHGFRFDPPASLFDGEDHRIHAYSINIGPKDHNPRLAGSPKVFNHEDIFPPTVRIAAPIEKSTVTMTTLVEAAVEDNVGVVKVEFYVDGAFKAVVDTGPYAYDWDSTEVLDGTHTLTAKAYDTAGNAAGDSVVVAVLNGGDDLPPDVRITHPADNDTILGTLNVRAWAEDNMRVSKVEFYADDMLKATDFTAPYSWRLEIEDFMSGRHTIMARAYDEAGHVGTYEIAITIERAPEPPPPPIPQLEVVGETETVFDWSEDACETGHMPDSPARAFRDADGKVSLFSASWVNYRMVGDSLDTVKPVCSSMMQSTRDPVFEHSAYNEWLVSPYTPDGQSVYSLVHNEWYAYLVDEKCDPKYPPGGWVNSVTLAVSRDGGRSFSHPDDYIILQPSTPWDKSYPCVKENWTLYGAMNSSNIIEREGYYYAFSLSWSDPEKVLDTGPCLMRTQDLGSASAWEVWTPYGWDSSRHAACAPIQRAKMRHMTHSLTYSTYLEAYVFMNKHKDGVYFSLSRDLFHWTEPVRFLPLEEENEYYSLLDPESPSRNFETTGREAYLYASRREENRFDLIRRKVRFTLPGDADMEPPSVAITSPPEGETVWKARVVRVAASDDKGIAKVEFFIDGTRKVTDTEAPYEYIWDTSTLPDGPHTVTVRAHDTASKTAEHSIGLTTLNTGVPKGYHSTSDCSRSIGYVCDPDDYVRPVQVRFYDGPRQTGARIGEITADVQFSTSVGAACGGVREHGFFFDTPSSVKDGGEHSIHAYAVDNGPGQYELLIWGSPRNITCGPAAPPEVRISTPAVGSTVTKTVTVEAVAAGAAGIAKVEFHVDGTLKGADTSSPYAYSWNTLGVADGTHTLTAKAYDSLDNTAEHPMGVIVRNGSLPKGHHDSTTCSSIGGWTCDPDDYSQPLRVHFYDGPAAGGGILGQAVADITREQGVGDACGGHREHGFRFDPPAALKDGAEHAIHVYAIDIGPKRHNPLIAGSPKTLTCADEVPPTVNITQPGDGDTILGTMSVKAEAEDAMGVARVEFYLDGASQPADTEAPFSFSLDIDKIASGPHTITAKAYDPAGNMGAQQISISVEKSEAPDIPPAPGFELIGEPETVFDWTTDRCEDNDIPDTTAHAFKDADGKVNLIATHFDNYRMIGDSLDTVKRDCAKIMNSGEDPDQFDNAYREWLIAPYSLDGETIYALVHNEWYGFLVDPKCNPARGANGWVNSITLAVSRDKGRTYSHPGDYLIVNSSIPWSESYPCESDDFTRYGMFGPSNIVKRGEHYYSLFQSEPDPEGLNEWGVCVMRTPRLDEAAAWEVWTPYGWDDSPTAMCAPVSRSKIFKVHDAPIRSSLAMVASHRSS
ncbi:Ig-like domain-containing protein [Elusimicrobiota bacterium]